MIENEVVNRKIFMMSSLSFDHPLSYMELIDFQNLLISSIGIQQIYFKDNVDFETIERVKLMLEGFPNVNDSKIEKYIMKELNDREKEIVMNMNFVNIETWNISYSKDNNKYMVTSLSKYRKIEEWMSNALYEISSNKHSLLEKIAILYDKVKLLEYDSNDKYERLPEIISGRKANSLGYNIIFSELLSKIGIKSCVEKIDNSKEKNYVTIAKINDDKYKVDGIYAFDPSMDTIYKDQYKNNLARKMNYNFFSITMDKLKNIYLKRNMEFFLKILCSDDSYEFKHFYNLYESKDSNDLNKKENIFGSNMEELYNMVTNTNELSVVIMENIMMKSIEKYPNELIDKESFTKVISTNYNERNKELFTNKYVKKMSKIDT